MRELELTNYRSYASARFELHPEVTLVVGPNATGQTNLLEAVYVLAATKSFRARDRDLVRHGEEVFRIVGRGENLNLGEETEYALAVRVNGVQIEKRVTHDGVKRPLVRHIGSIQVTLFEPTDLELVAGSPEARRRYLDHILIFTDPEYVRTLHTYKRTLRQRNALLSGDMPVPVVREQIFVWNVKLADLAVQIYRQRSGLLTQLNAGLPELYCDIAGSPAPLELTYEPTIGDETTSADEYGNLFLETLERNLPRDLGAGFTTIGPHREDFSISFKDGPIGAVASRGEVRTTVLALKLAEIAYAEEVTGRRPILLLDDVFSELYRARRTYLLGRLGGYQTIITTTDADAVTRELKVEHKILSTVEAARA